MNRKSEIEAVKSLGEKIGYGNLMDIASALWAVSLEDKYGIKAGAFVPTVLPFINKKDRKVTEERLDSMMEHVREMIK
ncbi:hypothetical protein [Paenibacillus sp. 1781tsa1]|uniref:hypothetical protein n=1 Tax=Paenibacillus sp. 1781tsa1 TaxID=2953810 RepID=UPI00209FF674|nr:hypothetical protein [Paenibacillus sp. 1781tsa1]MCP1185009.1 hypothetical protein [Paenibacillus sp. 1781tsa1]